MRSSFARLLFAALALIAVSLVPFGASVALAGQNESPALAAQHAPDDLSAERVLIVHYHRPDGNYDGWNVWAWSEGAEGAGHAFTERDGFGAVAVIPFDGPVDRLGFVVRKGDWETRDGDRDRFVSPGDNGVAEVWIASGDDRVFDGPDEVDLSVRLVNAFLDELGTLRLVTTGSLDRQTLLNTRLFGVDRPRRVWVMGEPETEGGRVVYTLSLSSRVPLNSIKNLSLDVPGFDRLTVYARDVLVSPHFTDELAPLGPMFSEDSTSFVTWSPVATSVELLLYDAIGDTEPARVEPLTESMNGIWSTRIDGDLNGTPYRYRFTSYGVAREAADIHCFAASADLTYSVVVDLDATDPEGWDEREPVTLSPQTDEIVYEIHVRDFTVADPTLDEELRGTYLGMVADTEDLGGVTTGLDHLLDLGVTAVHLLPIHDYPSDRHEYNWGYWTSLFNVPEGTYSTDDHDPDLRITELKRAIMALQEHGIRVILDVVYNHTSSSFDASPFYNTVPYYYFRTTPAGRLRNDAGVGNSIADERPMVRKYILDSLKFWVREYGVDGFRFDLLGTHRPETVAAICAELGALRPDLTLYGEPWTGGGPIYFGKGAQRGSAMAVFNDHLRNAIRGGLDGPEPGFATGPGGDLDAIRRGVMGAIDEFADHPTEVMTYASAHDNLTLWDKIVLTQPGADDETRRDMHKLALGVVLTSQGVAFLHGGSDFARTKGGNHNSYNAGDEVNKFDYERKAEYLDVFEYTRGLIELRRAQPLFRLPRAGLVRDALSFFGNDELIAFRLDRVAAGLEGEGWEEIVVIYNGQDGARSMELPGGEWSIVVDDERAGVESRRTR